MDQSIKIAHDALANPPDEIKEVMAGASDEAREALKRDDAPAAVAAHADAAPAAQGSASAPAVPAKSVHTSANTNGSVPSASPNLQIVDEKQEFTTKLDDHMQKWQLSDKGFSYDVVAVFGSQSTGKSTLLNGLFGTRFDVMNETERRQTTKGIWMSKGRDMSVLVMDVEGTDGRERGEDQDFERKSALFSMAVAEVLIVNIWEHQVGLYQGANMGLLKTVFEVNLGLFLAAKQKGKASGNVQDKTLLLFVIRDHIGATPLANLQNTLTADLNRIWDGLSKPEGLEDSQITTFFDLSFVTLPHKLLQPEQFESQVVALRSRFVDSKDPNFVFQPKYHKRIPADGISQYMSTIWDAVVTNKDLDLPTQQELLAQFRCDEIADNAFTKFLAETKSFPVPTSAGQIIGNLGALMAAARLVAFEVFDTAASRYHSGVYGRKRNELASKLNGALLPFYQTQLKNLHKSVLKSYRKSIQDGLKGDNYDFARVVKETREKAEEDFVSEAKKATLPETDWSYEDNLAQLREDVVAIADLLRAEETKKMITVIERNVKKQVGETVEVSLNKPTVDMWDKVLVAFKDALDKAEKTYLRKATSFNCTEKENEEALKLLRRRSWLALRAKIDEQTAESVMLVKLKLVFEEQFRYDAEGVPRVWRPDDDIDAIFKKAKEAVLALIPLYAKIAPADPANQVDVSGFAEASDDEDPDFDFDDSLTILSDTQADNLANRFRREADAYYLEAKRSMVSSISQIPYWMYGILVVLGWNEFVAVLRNPLYFTLILLLAAGAYVTYSLNMTGPVLAVIRGVSNEVVKTVNDQLHQYFEAQQRVPSDAQGQRLTSPVPAGSTVQESVELEEKKPKLD